MPTGGVLVRETEVGPSRRRAARSERAASVGRRLAGFVRIGRGWGHGGQRDGRGRGRAGDVLPRVDRPLVELFALDRRPRGRKARISQPLMAGALWTACSTWATPSRCCRSRPGVIVRIHPPAGEGASWQFSRGNASQNLIIKPA